MVYGDEITATLITTIIATMIATIIITTVTMITIMMTMMTTLIIFFSAFFRNFDVTSFQEVYAQGVKFPLSTPLLDMWRHLSNADLFLYITLQSPVLDS